MDSPTHRNRHARPGGLSALAGWAEGRSSDGSQAAWRRGDGPHGSDGGATRCATCLIAVLITVSSPINAASAFLKVAAREKRPVRPGNTVAPQDVIKSSGADILRMWVCA
jgi:hypothetical protein